jgi:CubicO group peptidase (beta-lactamase class C family)
MQIAAFHSAWVVNDAEAEGTGVVNDLFPWWSFTKTVLAVAVLRLVEVGKLAEFEALSIALRTQER